MAASYVYQCDNPFCPVTATIQEQMPLSAPDPMTGWISTRRRVPGPMAFGLLSVGVQTDEVKSFCSLACMTVWAQDQQEVARG